MKYLSKAFIGLITITIISACAGGISKTTINGQTTYSQNGKELSKEEVAAGNSLFSDQMAQEQRQARYQEELKKAPRRDASEAVSIALLEPIIHPGVKIYEDKLDGYWRPPFKNQKLLPLISSKAVRKSMELKRADSYRTTSVNNDWFDVAKAKNVPGDVYVQLIITTKDVLAKNSETKKVSMVSALVYRAEIASPYLDEKIVLEELVLNIVKNVEKLNTLGSNVRHAVETQVRPKLPSAKWIKEQKSNDINNIIQALTGQNTSE